MMNCPHAASDRVCLTPEQLQVLVQDAAHQGAREALAAIGLEDADAATDVRDIRSLISAWRQAKSTAWQQAIKIMTTLFLAVLLAGLAIKFGINPNQVGK